MNICLKFFIRSHKITHQKHKSAEWTSAMIFPVCALMMMRMMKQDALVSDDILLNRSICSQGKTCIYDLILSGIVVCACLFGNTWNVRNASQNSEGYSFLIFCVQLWSDFMLHVAMCLGTAGHSVRTRLPYWEVAGVQPVACSSSSNRSPRTLRPVRLLQHFWSVADKCWKWPLSFLWEGPSSLVNIIRRFNLSLLYVKHLLKENLSLVKMSHACWWVNKTKYILFCCFPTSMSSSAATRVLRLLLEYKFM